MLIDVADRNDGKIYTVRQPVPFILHGRIEFVPIGFRSDGMSVPRFFWRLLDCNLCGVTLLPATVHDWLYAVRGCDRSEADSIFLDLLLATPYPRWKTWLIYLGVRLFGWIPWRRNARARRLAEGNE